MEHKEKNQNFDDVDSIVFSAKITNEEAQVLQLLKEEQRKRLICPQVINYQKFLQSYSCSSGYHIYGGDLDTLFHSDMVISFGVWFQEKCAAAFMPFIKKLDEKKPNFIYMHPLEDTSVQKVLSQFIKYEVGSEEGVAALLVYTLLQRKSISVEVDEMLEELDIGCLSAESNVGEEELELMCEQIQEDTTISLILGSDLYSHVSASGIAKLIGLLEKYAGVNVLCVPPVANALGIALVCALDDKPEGRTAMYESCDEGTYLNVDKCLYYPGEKYSSGVEGLNRLGKTLGLREKSLDNYSDLLPGEKGFQRYKDSGLGEECIYRLIPLEKIGEFTFEEIEDLPRYDGVLVYSYMAQNPTKKEEAIPEVLWGSKQFSVASKLQDGELITFEIGSVKFRRMFKIDTLMKGVIALNPLFDTNLSADLISLYKYSKVAFEKINNQDTGSNDE